MPFERRVNTRFCSKDLMIKHLGSKKLRKIAQKRTMKINCKESIPELNSLEEITLTSQKLCEDYIHARLRRSAISDFDLASTLSHTDYSLTLLAMGQILELRYPKLFSKVSAHLRITYGNEAVVWGAFNKFAKNLFISGTTWARIIALFAFAGGLAVDCVAHGRAIFLGRIGYWLAGFVGKHLAVWIKNHGGWHGLVKHFSRTKTSQASMVKENQSNLLKRFRNSATLGVKYKFLIILKISLVFAAVALFATLMHSNM